MAQTSRPRPRKLHTRRVESAPLIQRGFALLGAIGKAGEPQIAAKIATAGLYELIGAEWCGVLLNDGKHAPQITGYPSSVRDLVPHMYATHTETTVPIVRYTQTLGTVRVWRAGRKCCADELALIEAVAEQLGECIERAHLLTALEHRTHELAAICETAEAISSQLDLPTTLHNIVEQAARLAHADGGGLYLCDESRGELEVVVSYCLDRDYRGTRIKLGEGLAGRAAVSHQIELVDNYATWEGRSSKYDASPFHAVVSVPLLQNDHLLGVIDVLRFTPNVQFASHDLAMIKRFAAQAVAAIANARLYDQAQQNADRMTALARSSRLLDVQANMATSLRPLVEETLLLLGATGCLVQLTEPKDVHESYAVGLSNDQADLLRQYINPNAVRPLDTFATYPPAVPGRAGATATLRHVLRAAGFRDAIMLPLLCDGRTLGCVTYFYSEYRRLSQDELELAHIIANQMAAFIANAQLYHQVHEANRLKVEFVSTMSHELRTPMGAIIGFTELLTNGLYGAVPESMREPLQRVQANADHLLNLINQMLDLSRIEANRLEIHQEPFSPRDLVQSVQAMMQPLATAKALDFMVTADLDVPRIAQGDVARLRQILINLIGNAVKFTHTGRIDLRCYTAHDDQTQLVFEIQDTGIGIPVKQRAFIWEPFRQGDSSSTREHGGTGLGLAIVQKLTQLMGGTASVDSVVGQGSTFTVRLPLHVPLDNDQNS